MFLTLRKIEDQQSSLFSAKLMSIQWVVKKRNHLYLPRSQLYSAIQVQGKGHYNLILKNNKSEKTDTQNKFRNIKCTINDVYLPSFFRSHSFHHLITKGR